MIMFMFKWTAPSCLIDRGSIVCREMIGNPTHKRYTIFRKEYI